MSSLPEPPDYEDRKIDLKAVLRMGLAVLVATVLAAVVCAWLLGVFHREYRRELRRETSDPFGAPRGAYPEPRLQVRPWEQRREVRAAEDAAMSGYAWEDRAQGVVRIPIERAIERMAAEPDPMRPLVAPPAGGAR